MVEIHRGTRSMRGVIAMGGRSTLRMADRAFSVMGEGGIIDIEAGVVYRGEDNKRFIDVIFKCLMFQRD